MSVQKRLLGMLSFLRNIVFIRFSHHYRGEKYFQIAFFLPFDPRLSLSSDIQPAGPPYPTGQGPGSNVPVQGPRYRQHRCKYMNVSVRPNQAMSLLCLSYIYKSVTNILVAS